jgi:hypothetical protein
MRKEDPEMKAISAVLFVLLLVSFAQAQQRWTRTYGGTHDEDCYSVQQTSDSGYIVAGHTESFGAGRGDVYLIKTNASGDTLWTRTYGGTLYDQGNSVQQTTDGGYVITGYRSSDASGEDVYLIKTNASGDTLWTRTYGGADDDEGNSVQQTSDWGYIIAGQTFSGTSSWDVCLIKTNASGDTLWTRTYGDSGVDEGNSIQQTSDGGYIIAGLTGSSGAGSYDVWLIKTNASGDTLWTRTYGGTDFDVGNSVQQTSDGGYIITGYTDSYGAGGADIWLIKTNASGDTLWTKTYGGAGEEDGLSVRQTSDLGYIIAGYTAPPSGPEMVWLLKTDASGDTLWTRTYGEGPYSVGRSVRQTLDEGYIVAGWADTLGGDVYLIKTDANGSLGVEEPGSRRLEVAAGMKATPNPFVSFARIPGHEAERFDLYDISGKMVGTCLGNRVGEGLAPAVYFIKLGTDQTLRIVKAR